MPAPPDGIMEFPDIVTVPSQVVVSVLLIAVVAFNSLPVMVMFTNDVALRAGPNKIAALTTSIELSAMIKSEHEAQAAAPYN